MYKQVFEFILKLTSVFAVYSIVFFVTRKRENKLDEYEEIISDVDMDLEFLKEVSIDSKPIYDIARLYSLSDLFIIRCMLFSCGINSYINYFNMSSIRPGVGIDGFTDLRLSVFEADSEEAKQIINEYQRYIGSNDKKELKNKVRNVIEGIIGNWFVRECNSSRSIEIIQY